jgi:hypothetical protein
MATRREKAVLFGKKEPLALPRRAQGGMTPG